MIYNLRLKMSQQTTSKCKDTVVGTTPTQRAQQVYSPIKENLLVYLMPFAVVYDCLPHC